MRGSGCWRCRRWRPAQHSGTQLRDRGPPRGIQLQGLAQAVAQALVRARGARGAQQARHGRALLGDQFLDFSRVVVVGVGSSHAEKLVQHQGSGEHVGCRQWDAAGDMFRRVVAGRSHVPGTRAVPRRLPVGENRGVHVDQVRAISSGDAGILYQVHVRRLQVAMHDADLGDGLQGGEEHTGVGETADPRFRHWLAPEVLEHASKVLAVHHEIEGLEEHRHVVGAVRELEDLGGHEAESCRLGAPDPIALLLLVPDVVAIPRVRRGRFQVLLQEHLRPIARGGAVAPGLVALVQALGDPVLADLVSNGDNHGHTSGSSMGAGGHGDEAILAEQGPWSRGIRALKLGD